MRRPVPPCDKAISPRYLFHDVAKAIAALPGLLWFRPRIVYESELAKKRIRGGALVIANHIGFFDPVYLQYAVWYRRHHFVCLQKFFDGPLWWMFKGFLCIPIDKDNVRVDTFRQIVGHLQSGEMVTLFPEGQVNDGSGQLASFKAGMVLMALQSQKPIVPVYIHKRRRFYHRLVMGIGEPVDPAAAGEKLTMRQINEAARRLQEKEIALSRLGQSAKQEKGGDTPCP
ncbi:MAG: lysophospholipid acyltransferase family protein [Acutalibacteraceae bacterium]|jgi:1-acyl-sn-glycerol-3-phosphate acyltransferase